MKRSVLFVCIHNSARSQMAEAFVTQKCGEQFSAYSAGLEAGNLNPAAVAAMRERGVDISHNKTKTIDDIRKLAIDFEYVITVCDESSAERCPVFPGRVKRQHWSLPDPSALRGNAADVLAETARIRDMIESRVCEWCSEVCTEA